MRKQKVARYQTMTEIATTEIKDAILTGVYQPGSKIVPAHLEKELELGKAAIRDAIRELTGKGLLINLPNKGTVVAEPISKEEIVEVFNIRYLLEGKAAFRAAQEISEEGIDELEAINEKLKQVPPTYSNEYFKINKEFHLKLYEHAGWSFLFSMIEQLFDQIKLYRTLYPFKPEDIKVYLDEHENVLSALKAKRPSEAQRRMVSHIKNGSNKLLELHKKQSGPKAI